MLPHSEKMIPVLTYTDDAAHLVAMEDIESAKIFRAGAIEIGELWTIITVIGIDAVIVHDFQLTPLDEEIARQIIKTYIGVVGLRSYNYYVENTLLSELQK